MYKWLKHPALVTGCAMFSMFFGSGNVIFPLVIGQAALDQTPYAILGLLLTAVAMPFAGLMAMILFEGDYEKFFARMGKTAGFVVAVILVALMGPFGVLPRCVMVAFGTVKTVLPDLPVLPFTIGTLLLVFLFTFRKRAILQLLGYVLTPLLLVSLGVIIVKGLVDAPAAAAAEQAAGVVFLHGLKEGYNTMDLLAAFFFSGVVLTCLKAKIPEGADRTKRIMRLTLQGSCVGAALLGLTYMGFCYVASFYGAGLTDVPADQLLASIALKVLGPSAGLVAAIVVASACLTTAIALAAVSAQFLHNDVCREKMSYIQALVWVLLCSFVVSTLEFVGIQRLLGPIVQVLYPALIVLAVVNIAHKLFGMQMVRRPVYAIFGASLASYLWL